MQTLQKIIDTFKQHGLARFRADQFMHAVYKEGKSSVDEMTNLSQEIKDFIKEELPIFSFEVDKVVTSGDKSTTKVLFSFKDGKKIEGVLMKFKDGRNTVCISSQVGCPLKCTFCATGTLGFGRNLTGEEIADQVLYFTQLLKQKDERLTNVVFMGMGEPLLNYDEVIKSLDIITGKDSIGLGARHITVSTAGIVEGIEKFSDYPQQVNLAISLHAPNQKLRLELMPIAKRYDIMQVINAAKTYMKKTHRRLSYEYVMLKNINDTDECADELGELLKGQLCHVNLIPYNATDIEGIEGSTKTQIRKFKEILDYHKVPATIRVSLGQDIAAACGQLANKAKQKQESPIPIIS